MLTGSLLRLPAIKVMNMEQSRCNADAKHIRHFLDICDGNWHSCIYVRCVSCKTPGYCNGPHFLYHPDENGSPCPAPAAKRIYQPRNFQTLWCPNESCPGMAKQSPEILTAGYQIIYSFILKGERLC